MPNFWIGKDKMYVCISKFHSMVALSIEMFLKNSVMGDIFYLKKRYFSSFKKLLTTEFF